MRAIRARQSSLPPTPSSFEILLALVDKDEHRYAILQIVESRVGTVLPVTTGAFYRALARLLEETSSRRLVRMIAAARTAPPRSDVLWRGPRRSGSPIKLPLREPGVFASVEAMRASACR
jgi:hypothetical protein